MRRFVARNLVVLAAAWLAVALAPAAASAEMVRLQFKPSVGAALTTDANLAPIAPGDAFWNPPTFTAPGDPLGNLIPRPGNPSGSTTDYVEFARTFAQGRDADGTPLRGDLYVDFAKVDAALPALVVIHGGLVKGKLCSPNRRISQLTWAKKFTDKGYIVFLADFVQPTNDVVQGYLGSILNKGQPGDCMADDGWEPGAKTAQVSLQLAVRSLKQQLKKFASAHPNSPARAAFANASKKVVAFGGSSGGHMATRLALRSEDASSAPGDGPQLQKERRVAAAIAISSIGDCTANNGVRNMSKYYGAQAFAAPWTQPFSNCGPITRDPLDSPVQFYNSAIYQKDLWNKWKRMNSPLSGAGGWGSDLGWDGVGDNRWAKRTCDDLNPGSCTFNLYPLPNGEAHYVFPLNARAPGTAPGSPVWWDTDVFPSIDKFLRTVKADDAV